MSRARIRLPRLGERRHPGERIGAAVRAAAVGIGIVRGRPEAAAEHGRRASRRPRPRARPGRGPRPAPGAGSEPAADRRRRRRGLLRLLEERVVLGRLAGRRLIVAHGGSAPRPGGPRNGSARRSGEPGTARRPVTRRAVSTRGQPATKVWAALSCQHCRHGRSNRHHSTLTTPIDQEAEHAVDQPAAQRGAEGRARSWDSMSRTSSPQSFLPSVRPHLAVGSASYSTPSDQERRERRRRDRPAWCRRAARR